jgi:predicted PurR-regulated permease PerM
MFQRQVNETFGGFFRAQIIIAFIYGLFTWLVLIGLGQPNGFLASLLAGLIMMIPFIGSFGAFAPPLLLVLLQTPNDQLIGKIVVLVLLLIVAQQIALQLIAPRVFGKTLGINPLILFAALLLGAKWGGVWGAFFAGPIVAVFAAVGEIFYDRYTRKLPLFQPDEETEDTAGEPPAEPVSATVVSRNGDVAALEGNRQHPAESATEQESATPRH